MQIVIENVAGCTKANIQTSAIALIAGANAAGKTSILRAISAAVLGDPLPVPGMTKGGAGAFVRTGASQGSARVSTDKGTNGVSWPDCQVTTQGDPIKASPISCGMIDLATQKPIERAAILARYIRGLPSRDDLATALGLIGIQEPERREGEADGDYAKRNPVDRIWSKIQAAGWEGAHKHAQELGQGLKRDYQKLTGGAWGSAKAEKWLPPNWTADLEDADEDALEAEAKAAQEAISAAQATAAVTAERRRGLEEKATTLREAQSDHDAAEVALNDARAKTKAAHDHRGTLTHPTAQPDLACCPHCNKEIEIKRTLDGVQLSKPKKGERLSREEIKKVEDAIKAAEKAIDDAEAVERQARNALTGAATRLHVATEAKKELEKMDAGPAAPESAISIDEARANSVKAEQRLAAFKLWGEASNIHRGLAMNQKIVDVLAADGVRKTVMGRQLEAFNAKQLKPLSEAAGWKIVEVDQEMAITYGGRSYSFLSKSEQLRVKYILQIATAQADGSEIVVLDEVDTLDSEGRRGLIKIIMGSGLYAILGCTYSARDQVPDLAEADIGVSYWLENGVAGLVKAEAAAA